VVLNRFAARDWWKADDRGYFVAKFVAEEIKALDEVAEAGKAGTFVTLKLEGTLADGETLVPMK